MNTVYTRLVRFQRKQNQFTNHSSKIYTSTIIAVIEIVLFGIVIYFGHNIFSGMYGVFKEMFYASENYGIFYALCLAFSFMIRRFLDRITEDTTSSISEPTAANKRPQNEYVDADFARVGSILLWMVPISVTFFVVVSTYAYTVFPFVPFTKGGANYVGVPESEVVLTRASPTANEVILKDLVVFYATDVSVYFAEVKDGDGPCEWRSRRGRPSIVEIPRSQIRSITKRPPRQTECN